MRRYRYPILFTAFLLYSMIGVVARSSTGNSIFDIGTVVRYAAVLFLLGVYSVLWQVSLKHIDLTLAFMCKGSVIVFSLFWAKFVFDETVSTSNIIGSLMVIIGIAVYSFGYKAN